MKFKLTDQNMMTHGGTLWEIGVEKRITTPGKRLCSNQVFHYYDSPEVAVLFNPLHVNFLNPRLFICREK